MLGWSRHATRWASVVVLALGRLDAEADDHAADDERGERDQ